MPRSLSKIVLHLIFSTKDRHPFLDAKIRPNMHAYLATICRNLRCKAYRVGGVAGHIHMACSFSRMVTVSKLVEVLKMGLLKMDRAGRPVV